VYYKCARYHLLTKLGPQLKGDLITMELPFGASTIATKFLYAGILQPAQQQDATWVGSCRERWDRRSLEEPNRSLVWSSKSLQIKQEGIGYISLPTAPDGYKAAGHVFTNSPEKPSLEKVHCRVIIFGSVRFLSKKITKKIF